MSWSIFFVEILDVVLVRRSNVPIFVFVQLQVSRSGPESTGYKLAQASFEARQRALPRVLGKRKEAAL
jgi:hypothetical protein